MDANVVLPFASSTLSFLFFILLIDQRRERRRPYQLVWAVGMLWYALSAGTECPSLVASCGGAARGTQARDTNGAPDRGCDRRAPEHARAGEPHRGQNYWARSK